MTDTDLGLLNSLGLPSVAERVVAIGSTGELRAAAAAARGKGPLTILGGGSNVVLHARVAGTVLLMRNRGLSLEPDRGGEALLTAAAGERWHEVVRYALGRGYGGLENLALIPGCAGAAPIQNIGAYGVELADRLASLRAFDLDTGTIREFDREACRFGYRDSVFKQPGGERFVVLELTLRVSRNPPLVLHYPDLARELAILGYANPSPVDVAEAVIRVRRRKLPDPRRLGNAGSFFKNPVVDRAAADRLSKQITGLVMHRLPDGQVKLAAAQLIDRCGWKGVRRGRVGVWPRQALVLVNYGGASAPELLELSGAIRRDVLERFGVELELEPRVLGQD